VHVGFALSIIDEQEARFVFDFLEKMNELDELDACVEATPRGSADLAPEPIVSPAQISNAASDPESVP
jgi:hypothetical protein